MSVVVTFFGGPMDGDTAEVAGAQVTCSSLERGPAGCFAIHVRYYIYEYVRLDSGRMMAVYSYTYMPDYPCMGGDDEAHRESV